MKHVVLAVVVVACSAPATPHAPHVPVKPVVEKPVDVPVPTQHRLRPVIEAPHTGAIVELALSPDGATALTADELGGVRLWPTLDGTQEPRIVALPIAKQLAVMHDATGFGIAVLDEVGGLYLARLDQTGRIVEHVTMSPDPPFTGIAMTSAGLLAWRSDQTLVLLDPQGTVRARAVTEPRERVLSVAVAGKRAVVLVEKEAATRAVRWLNIDAKLTWGAALKIDDPDAIGQVALSPAGTRLAVTRTDPKTHVVTAQIVDIAKATVTASIPVAIAELGFIDDNELAIGTLQGVSWLAADAGETKSPSVRVNEAGVFRRAIAFATGGGRAVISANGELAFVTPAKTEYLGYAVVAPRFVEPAPNGELLVGTKDSFTRLDANLRATGSPVTLGANLTQFLSLGGTQWLVESVENNKVQLSVVDAATGSATKVRDLKESNVMMFEPTSQLVTLSFGTLSEVARFDAKTKQLERLASIPKPSAYEQVLLVPLTGNRVVLVSMREGPTVKWLRDPRALDKPAATVAIDGSYAAADAAGHVYLWRAGQGGKLELATYLDGKLIAQLPSEGPTSLWPDRTGKTVALVGANVITLHSAADGKQLWARELASTQEAMWLDDGALAITSGGGIARLDPATGDVTMARCGWSFGLAAAPHPPTSRVESLCAQLDR